MLGLRGWPVAAEVAAVARDLAILGDVVRDVPGARLHLTHVSTGGVAGPRPPGEGARPAGDLRRHAAPPRADRRVGRRRPTLGLGGRGADHGAPATRGATARSWRRRTRRRCASTRRCAAPTDALACLAALADGTADAIATDHAPHTEVDKAVEFGLAANGISGIETALGLVLAAVDAGQLTLARAIAALTTGPAALLGTRTRRAGAVGSRRGRARGPRRLRSLRALDGDGRWPRVAGQEHAAARDGAARPGAADDGRRPGRLRGAGRLTPRSIRDARHVSRARHLHDACNGFVQSASQSYQWQDHHLDHIASPS